MHGADVTTLRSGRCCGKPPTDPPICPGLLLPRRRHSRLRPRGLGRYDPLCPCRALCHGRNPTNRDSPDQKGPHSRLGPSQILAVSLRILQLPVAGLEAVGGRGLQQRALEAAWSEALAGAVERVASVERKVLEAEPPNVWETLPFVRPRAGRLAECAGALPGLGL